MPKMKLQSYTMENGKIYCVECLPKERNDESLFDRQHAAVRNCNYTIINRECVRCGKKV